MTPAHDAVVLVGGGGTRLGGVDKAAVELEGRALVAASFAAAAEARTLVVVGRTGAPVPARALGVSEDPPGGGPAAGFVAGLRAVTDPAPWTLLLACDVPGAAAAVPRLLAALADHPDADGAVLTDPGGRPQWVIGIYRTVAVVDRLDPDTMTNRSLRRLLADLTLLLVPPCADEWQDIDTWSDHEHWRARLRTERTTTPHDGGHD